MLRCTECHHREQMASAATTLWHSILQNDMSLLSGKGYRFLTMFPACSIAGVTTTTTLYVKYTEEIQKVYPWVLSHVRLALCPCKSSNPRTPVFILFSPKEPDFCFFPFSFPLKAFHREKAPRVELRWLGSAGCVGKVRPARPGPGFTL